MTRSVNKVLVLGHLGRDAETNFTPSGIAVTKFSVATSRRWKDSQSNEWKEETDWHNIVLWRSENLANYLTKGKQVRRRPPANQKLRGPGWRQAIHGRSADVAGPGDVLRSILPASGDAARQFGGHHAAPDRGVDDTDG